MKAIPGGEFTMKHLQFHSKFNARPYINDLPSGQPLLSLDLGDDIRDPSSGFMSSGLGPSDVRTMVSL
jgi:hypothetical protein